MATILEDLQRAVLNSHVQQLGCRVVISALAEVNFAQLVVTLGASSIGSHAVIPVLSNNPEQVAVTLQTDPSPHSFVGRGLSSSLRVAQN